MEAFRKHDKSNSICILYFVIIANIIDILANRHYLYSECVHECDVVWCPMYNMKSNLRQRTDISPEDAPSRTKTH